MLREVAEVADLGEHFARHHHRIVVLLRAELRGNLAEAAFQKTKQREQLAAQSHQPLAEDLNVGRGGERGVDVADPRVRDDVLPHHLPPHQLLRLPHSGDEVLDVTARLGVRQFHTENPARRIEPVAAHVRAVDVERVADGADAAGVDAAQIERARQFSVHARS